MASFNLFGTNFEQDFGTFVGGWTVNGGQRFDTALASEVLTTGDPSIDPVKMLYRANDDVDLIISLLISDETQRSKFLDLKPLVPEKFRTSDTLMGYLDDVGLFAGTWIAAIEDLQTILDPYKIGEQYLIPLATLIGLEFIRDETTSVEELKRQLIQAIDWYKSKGTYQALQVIAFLSGLSINIYDLYTNDYGVFVRSLWFVGNEGENPSGLDSSYYKSPHFGIEMVLTRVYGTESDPYLWRGDLFVNLRQYVENIRPVNTVPEYSVLLSPETNESGDVITVPGNINTTVEGSWVFTRLYFDQETLNPGDAWEIDGTRLFDFREEGFLNSITAWKLGTGNKGVLPAGSGFALESVVIAGTVDDIRILSDRVEYEIFIDPSVVQFSISELGLYSNSGTILRIASTFPDIDKIEGVGLRIIASVFKL